MTRMLCAGDLRVLVSSREYLEQDSEVCINELCTLDMSRLVLDKRLTVLSESELGEVNMKLRQHLGI